MKTVMKENVGAIDQWLRFAAGFVLLFLAGTSVIGPWGYVLAVVPLATALFRFCPLYRVLGINTCPRGNPAGPDRP